MFPENTNTVVDKDRDGGGLTGTEQQERARGGENRGDESRWKGRKHEAGMTSLGLTFHSRPTPALCILTSLRCVSYILYLPCNPPPLFLSFASMFRSFFTHRIPSAIARHGWFFREQKKKRKDREIRRYDVQIEQPPISWTKGMLVTG